MAAALLLGIVAYGLALWLLRIFGDEEKRIVASLLPQQMADRLGLGDLQNDQ